MFRTSTFIVVIALASAFSSQAIAQLNVRTYEFGKNAYGFHRLPLNRRITTFRAESEAARIFQQIIGAQGISARVEIRASGDVDNAAAFLDDAGMRIIAYNVLFMEEVKKKTGRYWSLVSIMAHEVGHHLNFHTYVQDAPPPEQLRKDELEADYFSGHALARLGAPLDEALAAMRALSPVEESDTHPGRNARLQVIALGWKAATDRPNVDVATAKPEEPSEQSPISDKMCASEHRAKSPAEPSAATNITFKNYRGSTARIYWIDFNGTRKLYASVEHGQSHVQPTFMTHPWVVTDDTGRCLGLYLPEGPNREVVIP